MVRFAAKATKGGNWQVTDTQTGNACPKLYKGTPAGDCVYPADDFQTKAGAERFAGKMNKAVAEPKYKKAIAKHGQDADWQILIAAQH